MGQGADAEARAAFSIQRAAIVTTGVPADTEDPLTELLL